jgi:hypothetical protein
MTTPLTPAYRDAFVTVTSQVTGITVLELEATGLIDAHANLFLTILDASGNGDQFINAMQTLAADPNPAKAIPGAMKDAFFGPLLSNLICLWYLGEWLQLPSSWYVRGAQPSIDTNTIPSPLAYAQAFAWRDAGAHPPGSRPTGYGGWALPPIMASSEAEAS